MDPARSSKARKNFAQLSRMLLASTVASCRVATLPRCHAANRSWFRFSFSQAHILSQEADFIYENLQPANNLQMPLPRMHATAATGSQLTAYRSRAAAGIMWQTLTQSMIYFCKFNNCASLNYLYLYRVNCYCKQL